MEVPSKTLRTVTYHCLLCIFFHGYVDYVPCHCTKINPGVFSLQILNSTADGSMILLGRLAYIKKVLKEIGFPFFRM